MARVPFPLHHTDKYTPPVIYLMCVVRAYRFRTLQSEVVMRAFIQAHTCVSIGTTAIFTRFANRLRALRFPVYRTRRVRVVFGRGIARNPTAENSLLAINVYRSDFVPP